MGILFAFNIGWILSILWHISHYNASLLVICFIWFVLIALGYLAVAIWLGIKFKSNIIAKDNLGIKNELRLWTFAIIFDIILICVVFGTAGALNASQESFALIRIVGATFFKHCEICLIVLTPKWLFVSENEMKKKGIEAKLHAQESNENSQQIGWMKFISSYQGFEAMMLQLESEFSMELLLFVQEVLYINCFCFLILADIFL